ncbi:ABC transporter ATP-binding protein [Paenibacillus sambharensis]|uniref:ABC transporter ATP-binding protein n=1 Tax=Paenibacillus sambharensis TaxID=1803190 RepID=A0A2W1LA74_9BACL|nr:ABC transporter ATP-binding protein [Paenibacillus sambharensis]PZD95040.1 ABC transporter ATP-binding protein [Paenibacillus sambharensis]
MKTALDIENLFFGYGSTGILRGISLQLAQSQVVSIVGPNGSGKSTLLKCLARIVKPEQGEIRLFGKSLNAYSGGELAKKQGYVPQSTSETFPLSVTDAVLIGRKPHMKWGVSDRDLAIVGHVISFLGLEPLRHNYLNELSGGQRQKVAIARALAQEPEVLMLDEPTSALDIRHQLEVLELLKDLSRKSGSLVILVLHDLELAARYSDQLILMRQGVVHAMGKPEEVLTADHVKEVYGVEAEITEGRLGLQILALHPV